MGTVGQSAARVDSLPNIQFWYDASSVTYFNPTNPVNDDDITQWNSKLPSGRNAGPVGGTNKPQFKTAQAKDNLPAVYFEQTDNLATSLSTLMNAIPGYTLFIVTRPISTRTGTAQKFIELDNGELGFGVNANGKYFYSVAGGSATGPDADANWKVHTVWFDGNRTGADRLRHRINSSQVSLTTTVDPGSVSLTDGTTVEMDLARDTSGTEYMKGYIAEVMLCTSSLSVGEIISTENYLKNKWINPSQSYYSAPSYTASGLQMYYNPEDPSSYSGSGSTINDLSGNGYNGTLVNSPTYSTNSFTYVSGSSQYIRSPNMVSSFNSTSAFTVEVWYSPNYTTQGDGGSVLTENGTTDPTTGWRYSLMEHRKAPFGSLSYDYAGIWTTSNSITAVNPTATFNNQVWRCQTLTYDGTNGKIYTNGSLARTVALTRQMPWQSGQDYYLMMGALCVTQQSGAGNNYFNGKIGIVRAYNRALTAAEISTNYNGTKIIYGL